VSIESSLVAFGEKVKADIELAGGDALKLASFLSSHQTEITGLASLAGAKGTAVAAAASAVFSAAANAVESAGSAAAANGLSVTLDQATITAVQAAVAAVKSI
jgi:hypothetical protein